MRVFVAMSGGVDSSVAAALLVADGHEVTGVTMQLLPAGDDPGQCCGDDAVRSARRVCDVLGVPHYTLNMREVFAKAVIEPYIAAYARGATPNPCIACNDRVKFSALLARVRTLGADVLATGHYARIISDAGGTRWLARGLDTGKDQSYFLYRLVPPALDDVIFPLGELCKADVRAKAASLGLPSAARADSQEVCFVAAGDTAAFVGARVPAALSPGPIVDQTGAVLGTHHGIARYTTGQRKGLGITSAEPLYVTAIDAPTRTIHVGRHGDLMRREIALTAAVWRLGGRTAHERCERVLVQTRYRGEPAEATATFVPAGSEAAGTKIGGEDRVRVTFDVPVAGVAPGQAVVCYQDDRVVGGGVASAAS